MKQSVAFALTMFVVLPSLAAENQVSTPSPSASRFTPLDPFEQVKQMGGGQHPRLRPDLAKFRQCPLQGTAFSENP